MELLNSITQTIFLQNSVIYSNIMMVMIMTYVYMQQLLILLWVIIEF